MCFLSGLYSDSLPAAYPYATFDRVFACSSVSVAEKTLLQSALLEGLTRRRHVKSGRVELDFRMKRVA